jgi:UPF0755 protein
MEILSSPVELRSSHDFKPEKNNVLYVLGGLLLFFFIYFLLLSAPAEFPSGTMIRVEKGASLRSVSALLKREHVIRSRTAFEFFVILYGKEKNIISADYYFEKKLSVFEIARRIGGGLHHTAPVTVTIPEGFDSTQIADAASPVLQNFNREEFLIKAKPLEGYLFPDTYFFLTTADEDTVVKSMSANFEKKIAPLMPAIAASGKTENDIIIMASIIEREAKGDSDRGVISGILWKRISLHIALQVDAVPETYKQRGLPKSPIGNPGLDAMQAAINPQASPYLYYLHDKDGNTHYARTFAEHTANIAKYLK